MRVSTTAFAMAMLTVLPALSIPLQPSPTRPSELTIEELMHMSPIPDHVAAVARDLNELLARAEVDESGAISLGSLGKIGKTIFHGFDIFSGLGNLLG